MERNTALTVAILTLIAVVVAIMLPGGRAPDANPKVPWHIEIGDDGNPHVLGLVLGESTLADARRVFDDSEELTLFVKPDGGMKLEAYFERIALSGLRADVVLSLALPQATLKAMYQRGARASKLGSGELKVTLDPDDIATAAAAPISYITYLPVADLEPDLVAARFGKPARRIAVGDGVEHWLYPAKGLDITLNPNHRDVFEYLRPADFDRLVVKPLEAHLAAAAKSGNTAKP
jgi:hypothetical protein